MDWYVAGSVCLVFLIILIDFGMEAFRQPSSQGGSRKPYAFLTPSQVIRSSSQCQSASPNDPQSSPTSSKVVGGNQATASNANANANPSAGSATVSGNMDDDTGGLKRRRRRKRLDKKKATKDSVKVKIELSEGNSTFAMTGNQPDVYWRSIPLEHLRQHPRFRALPEPRSIAHLETLEDVRLFRQESWQWDTLHHGRCTTSQAVAALGFLEPTVGEVLGVPLSWRRGGVGAFVRLRQKALRHLDEMNSILCVDNPVASSESSSINQGSAVWSDGADGAGAARYLYNLSKEQVKERKSFAQRFSQNEDLRKSLRMMWGNTQEATALLTAINYFSRTDPDVCLEEVGMCGAGLDLNTTMQSSSLLIGATPDGVLRFSDGRIEALEVKNHCPFYSSSFSVKVKNKGGKSKRFSIGSQPFDNDKGNGVFSHYVPQLQLEMYCLGPECRSAVMVRQTATVGALVLRMHRDDEWIEEMLYFLHKFHTDYVERDKPPPKNFFWQSSNEEDRSRYRRFVNKTLEIRSSKVDIVGRIPNSEVQRMGEEASFFLD